MLSGWCPMGVAWSGVLRLDEHRLAPTAGQAATTSIPDRMGPSPVEVLPGIRFLFKANPRRWARSTCSNRRAVHRTPSST